MMRAAWRKFARHRVTPSFLFALHYLPVNFKIKSRLFCRNITRAYRRACPRAKYRTASAPALPGTVHGQDLPRTVITRTYKHYH